MKTGDVLLERFEIRVPIGEGGMGAVFRAHDRERGIDVALKTLRSVDTTALEYLKREFRALADLSHPNLITFYELVASQDRWFITMELIEGSPIDAIVPPVAAPTRRDRDGPEPLHLTDLGAERQLERHRTLLRDLAIGLSALHAAGHIHRDIKPSNVLVEPTGRLVVLDLGLAACLQQRRRRPDGVLTPAGTPPYMAPEQMVGQALTAATDWYSFGALLFELLTGQPPFTGSFREILQEKLRVDPPAPSELGYAVPPDLDDLCRRLLRRAPAERPTPEEVRLILDAHASAEADPRVVGRAGVEPDFVGRDAALDTLRAALRDLGPQTSRVVLIHGEPGVGKSRLIDRFLDEISSDPGPLIFEGRCHPNESVPFKALDSLIDDVASYLSSLRPDEALAVVPRHIDALAHAFPTLRSIRGLEAIVSAYPAAPDPRQRLEQAVSALRELFSALSSSRALVLSVDDLQWGDADSAMLLEAALRDPHPPRVLFLGCYRRNEDAHSGFLARSRAAADARDGLHVTELGIERLDEPAARALARQLLGAQATPHLVSMIVVEAAGNPFFLSELARFAADGGGGWSDRAERDGGPHLTLDDVVGWRTRSLPGEARRLLEVLTVAGQPMPLSLGEQAAGLGPLERNAESTLRSRRLVRSTGPTHARRIETYHDRIRDVVLARIDSPSLRSIHQRIAATLEAARIDEPDILATHFLGAGMEGRAAQYKWMAGERAEASLAFDRAAGLFRESLELTPGRTDAWAVERRIAEALVNAGHGAKAAQTFRSAAYRLTLEHAEPELALDLECEAAKHFLRSGHIESGLASLRRVLSDLSIAFPETRWQALRQLTAARARLALRNPAPGCESVRSSARIARQPTTLNALWTATTGLGLVDSFVASVFAVRHTLLAIEARDAVHAPAALAGEAAMLSSVGGRRLLHRASKLLDQADSLAAQAGGAYSSAYVRLNRGSCAYFVGDWKASVAHCDSARHEFRERCRGTTWEIASCEAFALSALAHLGRFEDLAERLPEALDHARSRGDVYAHTSLRLGWPHLLLLARDRVEEARVTARDAIGDWTDHRFNTQHYLHVLASAHTELYAGDPAAALKVLDQSLPLLRAHQFFWVRVVAAEIRFLRATAALGCMKELANERRRSPSEFCRLRSIATTESRRLARLGTPYADALARAIEAGLVAYRGDASLSAHHYLDAAKRFEALHMAAHALAVRARAAGVSGAPNPGVAPAWGALGVHAPERFASLIAPEIGSTGHRMSART